MANEKYIRISEDKAQNLHTLMEKVEGHLEKTDKRIQELDEKIAKTGNTDLTEVRDALAGVKENIATIGERMDTMDKILPRGEKVYTSPGANEAGERGLAAREEFARLVLDASLIKRGVKPRFSETARIQSETGGTGGDEGGLIVPDVYTPEILRLFESYGVARRFCQIIPMVRKTYQLPTNGDLPTVYWDTQLPGGAGLDAGNDLELNAPLETQVTVARPEMTAHKLIGVDTMSIEVIEDSIPGIRDFVADLFAIAISKEEDNACFMHTTGGTNPFDGGLFKLAGITEVTGSANTYKACLIDADLTTGGYAKILEVLDAADESVQDSRTSAWVCSNSIVNGIRMIRDTTGQPIWVNNMTQNAMQGGPAARLFNLPVFTSRVAPKMTDAGGSQDDNAFLLVGDGRFRLMGDRRQIQVDVSEHAAFREFGLVMRVVERVAFKTIFTAPFARLKTTA